MTQQNENVLKDFKGEINLLKKIMKKKKLLIVIIDKELKNKYDGKKLNISIKTLSNLFNLKKENVEIMDLNQFSNIFNSAIEMTPSYILFEWKDKTINILWSGEGYFLPKK